MRRSPSGFVAILVILALPLILYRLGSYSVVNADEAIYHAIAEAMVESGNWLHLDFRGEHRVYDTFMNAPLQYWARAVLILFFGSNLWTMRILSALFGLASVLVTYRLVSNVASQRAGFFAAFVQLTTYQFLFLHSARTGELETAICFFFTLSAHLFLRAAETKRSFVAHHLCLVVLLDLKVPIVALPLLAALTCFALSPRIRGDFRRWLVAGAVVLPLGLVWHVAQAVTLWGEFGDVARTMLEEASAAVLPGAHTGPLVNLAFYASRLLFGAFPWALVYPIALLRVLTWPGAPRERDRRLVLASYALAVFAFFLVVAKRSPWYVVPAYPFLSAFVGIWLSEAAARRWDVPSLAATAAMLALLPWLDVGTFDQNPFATPAIWVWRHARWRAPGGWHPALPVLSTFALCFGALLALRHWRPKRLAHGLATLSMCVFGAYALARDASALRHLEHESSLAALRNRLDRAREQGEPISYPIRVAAGHEFLIRYYFGRDFEIALAPASNQDRPSPLRRRTQFLLLGPKP